MKLKALLLGSMLALGASTAQAGTHWNGWYVSLEGGANWLQDSGVDTWVGGTHTVDHYNVEFDTGYAVLASAGYRWASHWRVEFELGFRDNDVDCLDSDFLALPCATGVDEGGDLWEFTQFINIVYDIPLGDRWALSLGAGVGGVLAEYEDAYGFTDDDYVFAGQLMAQLGYAVTSSTDLFIGYRYVNADDPEFENLSYWGAKADIASIDKEDHTLTIGFRFNLEPCCDTPTPPEPHGDPLPPPQEFIVFFGFNKSNLTSDAQKVVAEAATAAAQYNADQILVVGHTDTVGSNAYNMGLSARRAETVKMELVRLGVKESKIVTAAKGESELMVATGDGVKEPQNRRAVIVIKVVTQ